MFLLDLRCVGKGTGQREFLERDSGADGEQPQKVSRFLRRLEQLEAVHRSEARPPWDGIMSWEQITELANEGFEIGSHSVSHSLLTQCTAEELAYEVRTSKSILEERLSRPVPSFCYPDGDHDDRVVGAAQRAGYTQAVTTTWGTNGPDSHPLRLKRCDMNAEHVRRRDGRLSRARLAWRLSGLYPGLGR